MPWAPASDRHRRWSQLHHGIDPAAVPLLRSWLAAMWWVARPLAALRVPPTAITVGGAALAVAGVLLAASHPWPAAVVVVAAAMCDALDGAIAVVADRVTQSGAVADAVADRLVDIAFAVVLWRCRAPWWAALVAAVLAVGVDLLRRARRVPARITVGERPTWTLCTALACASAGATSAAWPVLVCAAVWCVAGVVALGQVLR